jgi:hypothetical protein
VLSLVSGVSLVSKESKLRRLKAFIGVPWDPKGH